MLCTITLDVLEEKISKTVFNMVTSLCSVNPGLKSNLCNYTRRGLVCVDLYFWFRYGQYKIYIIYFLNM